MYMRTNQDIAITYTNLEARFADTIAGNTKYFYVMLASLLISVCYRSPTYTEIRDVCLSIIIVKSVLLTEVSDYLSRVHVHAF